MLRKFKEIFSTDSLLDDAFQTTVRMLEFDHNMFTDSCKALRQNDSTELPYDFKAADNRINKFEREVRRKVLTHLTIAGNHSLVPGLVLVTVVIDVERIGDFTKNIAELAAVRDQRLQAGSLEETLAEVEDCISEQFPAVMQVLQERDMEEASVLLESEKTIARQSESVIQQLMDPDSEEPLDRQEAVRLALYARYLKRINAHLTNIASSVVNPFPRIGFREKKSSYD